MALSFSFDASKGETPESVASRRKSADLLAARIFGRTPQNVGEGLNSIGQALIARQMLDEANAAQAAGSASGNDAYSQIVASLSGGGVTPSAPVATAPMGGLPSLPPPQNIAPGKIYSNDEPSPLDPPSGADRDAAIRTVIAEAGNQGPVGMNAVASVIKNRAVAGNYGGDTAGGVVRAPNQFEPWNTEAGRAKMAAIDPNSQAYKDASAALDSAYFGNDPTNGAKNFIQPKLQTALGRPMPAWAQQPGVMIGDHKFIGGRTPTTQVASADDGAELPANATPAQGTLPTAEAVRGTSGPPLQVLMQAASNPWLSESQRTVVNTMLKQRLEQDAQASDPLRQAQIKLTTAKAAKAESGGDVEYGLNPIYGRDEKTGEEVLGTLGKDGSFKKIDTQGVKINSGVEKIDLGTHFQLRDRKSGQIVGTERKDIAGAKRDAEIGESQGKAVAAAPGDIQAGQNAIKILDQIEQSPYLSRGTGLTSLGNVVPGTGGYDFQNLVEQAKSGAFLQAIQQMRGLGSLSNAEGGAATAAITRMNTATSTEAFKKALSDYREIVQQGIDRGRARLANPASNNPGAEPSRSTPTVDDLVKKYGR